MANALFDPGRGGFLVAEIDVDAATIKCSLVRGYTFTASHKFVSDATGAGAVLVATVTLTPAGTPGSAGIFDANDIAFTAVAAGAVCNSLLIYQSSAVTGGADVAASAQRLIGFIDTATNLPVTPNGGDITVTWDNGANKIFKL